MAVGRLMVVQNKDNNYLKMKYMHTKGKPI